MAILNEIQTKGEITSPGQVMDYLRQLEDQIRYALFNLDGENIQAGAVGMEQLSRGVNNRISAAQTTADQSGKDAKTAQKAAEENAAKIKTLNSGLNALTARVATLNSGLNALTAQVATLDAEAVKKTTESDGFKLHLGATRPDGHGIVWIKPGTDNGDGTKQCEVLFVE